MIDRSRIPSVQVLANLLDQITPEMLARMLVNFQALSKQGAVSGSGQSLNIAKTGHSDPTGETVAANDERLRELAEMIVNGVESLKEADRQLTRRVGVRSDHFVRRRGPYAKGLRGKLGLGA